MSADSEPDAVNGLEHRGIAGTGEELEAPRLPGRIGCSAESCGGALQSPMIPKRRTLVFALITAAGAFLLLWLIVAVVAPLVDESACVGVDFGTTRSERQANGSPPRIGGEGGIAGATRSALRGKEPAVYCHDFADPFVLRVGDTYYAYSTNTEDLLVPVLTSDGLFGTGRRNEALAQVARWSSAGRVWAPSVLARPEHFVLYYTTRVGSSERQCVALALSPEPRGLFTDTSHAPLVCPRGGALDASPVVGPDGRAYLVWKQYERDATGIVVQELSDDGRRLVGPSRLLLEADQPWEGGTVEAPSMVAADGRYYLFYSGNDWATAQYAIGYAVCETPLGPCTKAPGPWLSSTKKAKGPGGQEVFTDEHGHLWLALHAWISDKIGYPDGARNLFVLPLEFVNGAPTV